MLPSELLSGLPDETKQALVLLMTSLKQVGKKRISLNEELILWQNRVKLAEEKGRDDLAAGAQEKYNEVQANLDALAAEEAQYRSEFNSIKTNLVFEATENEKAVDADFLQAQFDLFVGEAPSEEEQAVDKGFEDMNADSALDALKQQMSREENQDD